jgi:hypothetical protein
LLQRVLETATARSVPPSAALARDVLEAAVPPPPNSKPAASRSSGIVAAGPGVTRSREKMVWEWSEVAERVIEEWR